MEAKENVEVGTGRDARQRKKEREKEEKNCCFYFPPKLPSHCPGCH